MDIEALRRRLEEAEATLARLRLVMEVVGTTDLATGIHNRNGVLEAIERRRRWMNRRGDMFGVLVVCFANLRALDLDQPDDVELVKHLAAVIGAGVREVDDVGRLDEKSFASVLADIKPGSMAVVVDRVVAQLETDRQAVNEAGGVYKVAAVELLTSSHAPEVILDAIERLLAKTADNASSISQL